MSREPPGPADVVVTALSPILVIGLVGSLAFFLIELGYHGDYPERLRWTLFFFVVACVLVARIAITLSKSAASAYGSVLGLVTLLAINTYVKYPSGAGLSAAGWLINLLAMSVVWWSANQLTWDCTFVDESADDTGRGLLEDAGFDAPADPDAPRPPGRTPGVWVIYFVLATLPLYGLGQSLIPPEDAAGRRYAFWLMVVYTGSGLGLLMTTSFLSLRRYLRQRRLRMPATMTATWLSLGGILIAVFLLVGALLPRPHPEYALFRFPPVESPKLKASDTALDSEKGAEGDGRSGGRGDRRDAKDGGGNKGNPGGQKGKDSADKSEQASSQSSDRGKARANDPKAEKSSPGRTSDPPPSSATSKIWEFLRWLVFAALILATIVAVVWLVQRYWQTRAPRRRPEAGEQGAIAEPRPGLPPFAAFADPFADGRAEQRSPEWLVRYSFAALESWAAERQRGRSPEETPIEFARRLAAEEPALDPGARHVGNLYARLAYAGGALPSSVRGQVASFWKAV